MGNSEDIVKIKYKATAELVADGIKKAVKPSDVKREAQQRAKAMQSAMDNQKIEIPAEIVPDTSKFDKVKKEAEKPIKTPVKLETENVDLPLLGKTPIKLSIDKDSRTAIKKTLGDAEKTSKDLIKAATDAVKKIGSANYLEDLNDRERQAISTAVSKVKRNNPGISEDRLKTFEQNLTLDRRAKKTHDTLSENFRLPSSSSKAYKQEMYEAAITAAKIQAAVKIREGLHKDEGYTKFLSENDKSKNFNGNTLKIPGKFIDQIQNGLYEHFGVNKLGTALASDKNWTGIQDRMSQSVESFSTGLAAVIDASIPKTSLGGRITKKFQQRVDSAVEMAIDMSVDDAVGYLTGKKGVKENKEALSLLGKKKDGEYEYSVDDILDILEKKSRIGKEGNDQGTNYKGFSQLLAALQVYNRNGASGLSASYTERLSELVDIITSTYMGNDGIVDYDAQTIIKSINAALDQAQVEAEKAAKELEEQSKIKEKSKPKKSNKKSSPTIPIEQPKKAEKKVEQKQPDKTEEIEEPKYSFAPRLTKNNQEKHGSRFAGRLYDQKQLMDFASAPLNRSPKIKSNSGIFDKNGNYYVVSGATSVETRQVTDNYDSILKSTKKIDAYNKSELGLIQKQEKYTAGTDEHNSIAKQIKEVTDARKQEQESIKKIVGNNGVDTWVENNKSVLEKEKKDISELTTARRNVEASERSITDFINQSSISDRYKAAISDIKEFQRTQEKLSGLQKEQIENPNKDLSSDIADAVSEYKRLSGSVKDFRENVYDAEKSQKELTDNKQFKEYNSAYNQTTKNVKDNQKSLSQSLKDAYKTQNRYEKKLLTPGTYNNSQNVTDAVEQLEYAKRTASFIEKQMREVHGNEYANKEIARIQSSIQAKTGSSSSIFSNSETMSANIGNISEKLSAYTTSIEKANKATEEFTNRKQGISEKISALKDDYDNGNLSVSDYAKRMQEINNDFNALKEYMTTGAGKNASEYIEVFNKLNKLENSTNKVGQYHEILQGFKSEFQKIKSDYEDDGDLDKYNQSISNLVSRMKDFQKISKNFVTTNSKGTLIGESIGKVSDINDATTALENYATKLGYVNKTSQSINESTGKVNMTFENASGNVLKMSGVIEELNENMKGLRVSTNVFSGSGSGPGSLLGGLKNLVSGNFKSIVGEIGSSVANVQILGQAFQQMKEGFNTFLDFNKGLTNISYTMDMSKEQLSSLGSSAVDMAKDLSMSLDNTMDIYQIYANMNTTSKEIQETAKPTAILSNLSGVDASTAADQVQGILQQFHMLEDGSTTAADASMHVVDVLDKISGAVGMDYAKGIKVMTDAVQASGQVAYDAGMSYEQLAAISAKVAERTREDGSSIGNALKTIITRTTKVGKMPQYADEVDNATLSNASESLHSVGIDVYNPDGSDRGIITVLSELKAKWDDLSDAQQAKIAFDVAATRQTSKFKSILDAFSESMTLAGEATTTSGNAEANQEKYMESFSGKIQAIKTQMDEFWLNFYNSDQVSGALDFVQGLAEGFTGLEEAIGPIPTLITAVFSALTVKNAAAKGLEFLVGKDGQASGLANAVG